MSFFKRLWDNPTETVWDIVSEYPQTTALTSVATASVGTYMFYRSQFFQKYKLPIALTSAAASVAGVYYGYQKVKPFIDEFRQAQQLLTMMNVGATGKARDDVASMQDDFLADKSSNSLDLNSKRFKRVLEAASNGYIGSFLQFRPVIAKLFQVEECRQQLVIARQAGDPISHLECLKFSAIGRAIACVYIGTLLSSFHKVQLSILSRFQQFDLALRSSIAEKKKSLSARKTMEGKNKSKNSVPDEVTDFASLLGQSSNNSSNPPTIEEEELTIRSLESLLESLGQADNDFLLSTHNYQLNVFVPLLCGLSREIAVAVGARNAVNSNSIPTRTSLLLSDTGSDWASELVTVHDARDLISDLRSVMEDSILFQYTTESRGHGSYLQRINRFISPLNKNPASSFDLCSNLQGNVSSSASEASNSLPTSSPKMKTTDSPITFSYDIETEPAPPLLLDLDPSCSVSTLRRFSYYMSLQGENTKIDESSLKAGVADLGQTQTPLGNSDKMTKVTALSKLQDEKLTQSFGIDQTIHRPFCSVILYPYDARDMEADIRAKCPSFATLPMDTPSASYPARVMGAWAELLAVLNSDAFVSSVKEQLDINFALIEKEIIRLRFTDPRTLEFEEKKQKSSFFLASTSEPGVVQEAFEQPENPEIIPDVSVTFLKMIMGYVSMFDSVWVKNPRHAPVSMVSKELTTWNPIDEVCKVIFLPMNAAEEATCGGKSQSSGGGAGLFGGMDGLGDLGLGDLGDFSGEDMKELEQLLKALEQGGF